ncbi:hypothetical protein [Microbacterium sp. NPDC089696]
MSKAEFDRKLNLTRAFAGVIGRRVIIAPSRRQPPRKPGAFRDIRDD